MNAPRFNALVFFGAAGDLVCQRAALTTIALTVPVVIFINLGTGLLLTLGLSPANQVLLATTLQRVTPIGGWQNPVLTGQQSP